MTDETIAREVLLQTIKDADPRRKADLADGEGVRGCKECQRPLVRKRWRPIAGATGLTGQSRAGRKVGILESRANFARRQFCDQICAGRFAEKQGCEYPGCPNKGRAVYIDPNTLDKSGPYCTGHRTLAEVKSIVLELRAGHLPLDTIYDPDDWETDTAGILGLHERYLIELTDAMEANPIAHIAFRRGSEYHVALRERVAREMGIRRKLDEAFAN